MEFDSRPCIYCREVPSQSVKSEAPHFLRKKVCKCKSLVAYESLDTLSREEDTGDERDYEAFI